MYTAYAYDESKTHHDNVHVSLRVQHVSHDIASPPIPHPSSSSIVVSEPSPRDRSIHPTHLTVVLVQPRVHGVDDVRTNRGQENFRQGARRAVAALDGDHGKRGRHGVCLSRSASGKGGTRRGSAGLDARGARSRRDTVDGECEASTTTRNHPFCVMFKHERTRMMDGRPTHDGWIETYLACVWI